MSENPQPDDCPARKWRGSSRQYLMQRLKEAGRDDLIEAIEMRRISARRAAVGLGWIKEVPSSSDSGQGQRRQFEMTAAFAGEAPVRCAVLMELIIGPNSNSGSLFRTREELEQAWRQHQGEVMCDWTTPARRPAAWHEFEWKGEPLDYDHERSGLWRADILEPEERVAIEAEWFAEFQSAYSRGLDAAGRRKHHQWADIPRELVRKWSAERRRRGRTIKQLAGEAQEPAPPVI